MKKVTLDFGSYTFDKDIPDNVDEDEFISESIREEQTYAFVPQLCRSFQISNDNEDTDFYLDTYSYEIETGG